MPQPVREDVGEANDHRRVQIARLQSLHDLVEIDLALRVHARTDDDVAVGIDGEVALAPGLDLIEIERFLDLPGVIRPAGSFAGLFMCAHHNKLRLHVNDADHSTPASDDQPRATGRFGSRIHSLQEPA